MNSIADLVEMLSHPTRHNFKPKPTIASLIPETEAEDELELRTAMR